MYGSAMLHWTRKAVSQAVHFNRMESPDGVRDRTRIGETEYYDHTAGNVLTGFTPADSE